MALSKIGSSNGVEATRQRLNILDKGRSAYNTLFGKPGTKYPEAPNVAVEGTMNKLIDGHNDYVDFRELMNHRPF